MSSKELDMAITIQQFAAYVRMQQLIVQRTYRPFGLGIAPYEI